MAPILATNLGSNQLASAAPIPPPNITDCVAPKNLLNNEILDIDCCPPLADKIIDYKLPPPFIKRFRPSAHQVTPEYIFKYNTAVDRMKRLPKDDPRNFMQQANVHCAYCNEAYEYDFPSEGAGKLKIQVHDCWLFFPFHRWYLYFYERILGSLINDPTFGLPFWHWDSPRGMSIPPMYFDPKSALFNENRNQSHLHSLVNLNYDDTQPPAQTIANNLSVMYDEMIGNAQGLEDFMGKKYVKGDNINPGPGTIDRGCHSSVHKFVGDPRQPSEVDMGNFYSTGREPLFFAHHATGPSQPKEFTDPDWLNTEFLFYDENKQLVRVKVADTLDQERMGYVYQRVDNPWIQCRPLARAQKTRAAATSNAPKADKVVFPLKLDNVVKVLVPRPKKSGIQDKEEEFLLIQGIEVDTGKFVKFDVFVNDEDETVNIVDRAEYAGTFAQVPHKHKGQVKVKTSIRLRLTELFEDLRVEDDDDAILVALVPKAGDIAIGGIKIIYAPV
ncbi:hypothetical protein Pfo_022626 [Paulownia fortunei]|nr:hypothetical protein Pfo_022626 [Paulownia fortunei]